ncbi:MAG: GIY-YIG nuclease family protein [Candidatus Gottesmanbacteria bacterium]|nr:GIY-YIG nuclease family protein [Candidatus Gottesmanbacteria bacterium]
MHSTYILRSKKDNRYYIGSTDNLEKRLQQHNSGRSPYTKGKGPFVLAYKEDFITRSEAKQREYYLKSLKSRIALEKIMSKAAIV